MNPMRKRSVPAHIEETIGRRLLFRENPTENEPVESIEALMRQFEASKPTAREGMQRLLATGLVVAGRGHSFVSPPLHYARGLEALELETRCADTPERRRRAFTGWLECLHHVTRHALRDAMGRRSDDVRLLKDELERLTGVGYSSYDPEEMASAVMDVIWLAAKASENGALLLFANSLTRGFPFILPWLAASIQNRQMADAWLRIERRFRAEDRSKLDDAVAAVFSRLAERVRAAAEHARPEPMAQGYQTQNTG